MRKSALARILLFTLIALTFGAHASPAPEKEWNFLVFLNGNNNLDSFGKLNVNQMEQVGSMDHVNILVQWASMARTSVQRLYIQKDTDVNNVTSPVVQDMGPVDMGSPQSLTDFIEWARVNYPAKRWFITVWNHGSGWHRKIINGDVSVRDISSDDKTGNVISTEELGQVMNQTARSLGHPIDIYASDACLMAMAEVADEMNSSVHYFGGSQDLEPGTGWPYHKFFERWQQEPNLSTRDVARVLSEEYLKAYRTGGVYRPSAVTFSIFDLTKLPAFKSSLAAVAQELSSLNGPDNLKLREASARTKNYYYSDYKDIVDFLDQAAARNIVPASGPAFRQSVQELVVANDQNFGSNVHGISVWLPEDLSGYRERLPRYQGLSFHRATGWADFIQTLLPRGDIIIRPPASGN